MRKNKIILISVLSIILVGIISIIGIEITKKEKELNRMKKIEEISNHFSHTVEVIRKTSFYKKENENYILKGTFEKGVILLLEKTDIHENTKYFLINNFDEEYYVSYEDVTPTTKEIVKNERYKKYIPFNINIQTKQITNFYKENNLQFTFHESFQFPVIRKEEEGYYVEFNNELYYVKKEDVEKTVDSNNSKEVTANKIPTLAYHFIYNSKEDKCDQPICHTYDQINSHMNYLKEENYFTPTMEEFELWIDGKINLPKNSILITVDDGWHGEDASYIFTQNQMNATIFVVSKWYDPKTFETTYFEVHSHGHDLHNANACPGLGKQGGGILCLPESTLLADLKISREKTNNTTSFAYPFYDVNDYAVSILKKAGFTMAFIGVDSNNNYYATRNTDKFRIPRITLHSATTVNDLKKILSN